MRIVIGNLHYDSCSDSDRALDNQRAAQHLGALLYPHQAQASLLRETGYIGVKAKPIIFYHDNHAIAASLQENIGARGMSVPHNIGQRLLDDTIYGCFHICGQSFIFEAYCLELRDDSIP